jgi:UDP-3-O-[3-hydroxymyristoyl] glucosamine N-acyltransferase
MFIRNEKPIKLIGYTESSLTQEMLFLSHEAADDVTIIEPKEFKNSNNKDDFQYIVSFGLDLKERAEVCLEVDKYDVASYVHRTAYVATTAKIGKGTCVGPFSTVMQDASIGQHSILETYCLISHYTQLGDNCILHSGTMLAGKSTIGNNVMFNFKSGATNKLKICDNAVIGAFSNVTKNIEKAGMYVGSPARCIKAFE